MAASYPSPGQAGYYVPAPPAPPVPGAPGVPPAPYPGMAGAAPQGPPQNMGYAVYPQAAGYGGAYPVYSPYALAPAYPAAPVFTGENGEEARRKAPARAFNRMSMLALGQIALSVAWSFVLAIVFSVAGIDYLSADSYAISVLTGAVVVLSTGLVPFLFFVAGGKKTVDFLKFQKIGFLPGLLCVLAGSALLILSNIPAVLLQDALAGVGYEPSPVDTSAESGTWMGLCIDFMAIAVLGPMLEEIMHRGIMLTTLRRYGIGFAVVASGLLFGMNHLDLTTMVAASLAGMVLGFFYARTNNLWLTIWMHAINNACAILGSYSGLICPQDPDRFVLAMECGVLGLGLVSLVLLLIFYRNRFITRRSPRYDGPAQPLGVGKSLGAMVRAPMFWVFLGLVGAYFASSLWVW